MVPKTVVARSAGPWRCRGDVYHHESITNLGSPVRNSTILDENVARDRALHCALQPSLACSAEATSYLSVGGKQTDCGPYAAGLSATRWAATRHAHDQAKERKGQPQVVRAWMATAECATTSLRLGCGSASSFFGPVRAASGCRWVRCRRRPRSQLRPRA